METQVINSWKHLSNPFNRGLSNALQQQHHAAQFIAMAGRHLVPRKPYDSNTNMRYYSQGEWIVGNEIPGGLHVALYLPELKLFLVDNELTRRCEISLPGKTKVQAFLQLKRDLSDFNVDTSGFTHDLHYTIPHHELNNNSAFTLDDRKDIYENNAYRHNAELVLNRVVSGFEKAEPVRIWPHHFDSGSFIPLAANADGSIIKSIGLGWAIPDEMVDEPYYYLSYWSESPVKGFKDLPSPDTGEWIRTGWNGGILKNSDIIKNQSPVRQHEMVEAFFRSGIEILTEQFNT